MIYPQIKAGKNNSITIAKAIGIILVVFGHSCNMNGEGFDGYIRNIIYLFHVPLFFFVSGYLFKWEYISAPFTFLKKKIKGLWVPYVKWMMAFLILHNFFKWIGFYGSYQGEDIAQYFGLKDIVLKSVRILILDGSEQLLGGFWFIPVLFFAVVWSYIILYLFGVILLKISEMQMGGGKYISYSHKTLLMIAILLTAIISAALIIFNFKIATVGITPRIFLASSILLAGALYKEVTTKLETPQHFKLLLLFISGIALIALPVIHYAELGTVHLWYDVPYLFVTGCVGSIVVIYIASLMHNELKIKHLKECFYVIGNSTLTILALHFLCFKLVNLIKIWIYGLDLNMLGCFPIIYNDPSENNFIWVIAYTLIGIAIPCCVKMIFMSLKIQFK